MNREDIIRMAREACPYTTDEMRGAFYEGFLKGAAAEREAICPLVYGMCGLDNDAERIVRAIRARGNT